MDAAVIEKGKRYRMPVCPVEAPKRDINNNLTVNERLLEGNFSEIDWSVEDMNTYHEASVYEKILETDEDFYRAISADEFRKRLVVALAELDKKYASKCK